MAPQQPAPQLRDTGNAGHVDRGYLLKKIETLEAKMIAQQKENLALKGDNCNENTSPLKKEVKKETKFATPLKVKKLDLIFQDRKRLLQELSKLKRSKSMKRARSPSFNEPKSKRLRQLSISNSSPKKEVTKKTKLATPLKLKKLDLVFQDYYCKNYQN